MKLTNYSKKDIGALIIVACLLGVFFPFFSFEVSLPNIFSLERYLVAAREFGIFPGTFSSILFCIIIPLAVSVIMVSNIVTDEYTIVKNYSFIRMGNLKKWFLSNCLKTYRFSLIAAIFFHGGMLGVCMVLGFHLANLLALAAILAYAVLVFSLCTYMIAMLAICLSFLTNLKNAVLLSEFILIGSFVLSTVLPFTWGKWLWSSAYFVYWHHEDSVLIKLLNDGAVIPQNTPASFSFSILFLISIVIIESIICFHYINRSDYL